MTTGGAEVGAGGQDSTGWQSPGKLQLHFNAITMATAQSARRCPSACLCSRQPALWPLENGTRFDTPEGPLDIDNKQCVQVHCKKSGVVCELMLK